MGTIDRESLETLLFSFAQIFASPRSPFPHCGSASDSDCMKYAESSFQVAEYLGASRGSFAWCLSCARHWAALGDRSEIKLSQILKVESCSHTIGFMCMCVRLKKNPIPSHNLVLTLKRKFQCFQGSQIRHSQSDVLLVAFESTNKHIMIGPETF